MALLPPTFLDAVVAIGVGDDPTTRAWVGTGFLYGLFEKQVDKDTRSYHIFLVSNRHVLEGHKKVWLKFNSSADSTSQDYEVRLIAKNGRKFWVPHSKEDVGALFINAKALTAEGRLFSYFQSDQHISHKKDLKSRGITEGDGVYVLGFPMGMVDSSRQYVIVRSGGIARIRDLIDGSRSDYLVDAFVFPGNSGGPVVLQPEMVSIKGTSPIRRADLIGIVTGYVSYRDSAVSRQTGQTRIVFEENSGLTSVLPVDVIDQTAKLAMKRLKSRMAQAKWRSKRKDEEP